MTRDEVIEEMRGAAPDDALETAGEYAAAFVEAMASDDGLDVLSPEQRALVTDTMRVVAWGIKIITGSVPVTDPSGAISELMESLRGRHG